MPSKGTKEIRSAFGLYTPAKKTITRKDYEKKLDKLAKSIAGKVYLGR